MVAWWTGGTENGVVRAVRRRDRDTQAQRRWNSRRTTHTHWFCRRSFKRIPPRDRARCRPLARVHRRRRWFTANSHSASMSACNTAALSVPALPSPRGSTHGTSQHRWIDSEFAVRCDADARRIRTAMRRHSLTHPGSSCGDVHRAIEHLDGNDSCASRHRRQWMVRPSAE